MSAEEVQNRANVSGAEIVQNLQVGSSRDSANGGFNFCAGTEVVGNTGTNLRTEVEKVKKVRGVKKGARRSRAQPQPQPQVAIATPMSKAVGAVSTCDIANSCACLDTPCVAAATAVSEDDGSDGQEGTDGHERSGKASKYTRGRAFAFTSHNVGNYEVWAAQREDLVTNHHVKYMVYQHEQGGKRHNPHLQGYIEVKNACGMLNIKKILNDEQMHIEVRRGTAAQARDYCMKPHSRVRPPVEIGVFTTQGQRVDILAAHAAIQQGASVHDVRERFPSVFYKYANNVTKSIAMTNMERLGAHIDVTVNVLIGDPGTGKTSMVRNLHRQQNIYRLKPGTSTVWFDGYDGQPVLLIDEFTGWMPYEQLLDLLDEYVGQYQIKGGTIVSAWTHVYIVSNHQIKDWYPEQRDLSALYRRILGHGRGTITDFKLSNPATMKYTEGMIRHRTVTVDTHLFVKKEDGSFDPTVAYVSDVSVDGVMPVAPVVAPVVAPAIPPIAHCGESNCVAAPSKDARER